MSGTLVVGANQAGIQIAVSLREGGDTGPITVVGVETHPPYQRPPLSKAFLAGTVDLPALAFRTPEFYRDNDISVVGGVRIQQVGPGWALDDAGVRYDHDRLALAVGARARRLRVPGADLTGVHHLRDADDAANIRADLAAADDVVVIGGGFIGLETAASADPRRRHVTVVEAAPRLMGRAVAPETSTFYRDAHERRGVRVLLDTGVSHLRGAAGRVCAVVLSDGRELPADVVLVGVGVTPRTELAAQLGLDCDGGIVVDANGRTSRDGVPVETVVAAGDCAAAPHPVTGQGRVRLESVPSAIAQARSAAAGLLGRIPPPVGVPWFWSDQYDLKLQIAGLSTGYDGVVTRGDPASESFAVLYYRGETLLAVDAVNRTVDYLTVRTALTRGVAISREAAADEAPLKRVLTAASGR